MCSRRLNSQAIVAGRRSKVKRASRSCLMDLGGEVPSVGRRSFAECLECCAHHPATGSDCGVLLKSARWLHPMACVQARRLDPAVASHQQPSGPKSLIRLYELMFLLFENALLCTHLDQVRNSLSSMALDSFDSALSRESDDEIE